jgi:glycerophosphoryl diester phosphodiesterase
MILLLRCNILHIKNPEVHPFLIQVPKIMNIAHAGGKGLGPENTLITLHNAVKSGADILEIDIHSTLDSVLVLLHDHL